MTGDWLEEATRACGLAAPTQFPRDLLGELPWSPLLVEAVALPQLTPEVMRDWLQRRGIRHPAGEDSRELRGCMVADRGRGILFYDNTQGRNETRFTIAHELSHFVLEQWLPRRKAVRVFGESILPVLDGDREPTDDEVVTALFERVPLQNARSLMGRDASGLLTRREVLEAEHHADLLALELLAPAALAAPLVSDALPDNEVQGRLVFRFGLPWDMAESYVLRLRRRLGIPRFSIDQFLGVDGE
ncbi:ImmA/IrrE family metallo-endopeptidase [Myxococcaceae bacterium JPH2]|nr:ImmA/IrrE family metallo-endopeptidase [Myxococcaceae bacterium JPH2]